MSRFPILSLSQEDIKLVMKKHSVVSRDSTRDSTLDVQKLNGAIFEISNI